MWLPRQLALKFATEPTYDPADFFAAESNQAALDWVARTPDWPDRRLLLWGEAGCGKTHLLRNWVAAHGAAYVDATALRGLPPAPPPQGVAIDNVCCHTDATALLHLLNAARDAGAPVLLAARTPPARWTIDLPDLASRLRAILAIQIRPPGASLLRALLARLLAERQLRVPQSVQDWLLLQLPRTAQALAGAVIRLDNDVAEYGSGPMTRPRAAAILGLQRSHDERNHEDWASGDEPAAGEPGLW